MLIIAHDDHTLLMFALMHFGEGGLMFALNRMLGWEPQPLQSTLPKYS